MSSEPAQRRAEALRDARVKLHAARALGTIEADVLPPDEEDQLSAAGGGMPSSVGGDKASRRRAVSLRQLYRPHAAVAARLSGARQATDAAAGGEPAPAEPAPTQPPKAEAWAAPEPVVQAEELLEPEPESPRPGAGPAQLRPTQEARSADWLRVGDRVYWRGELAAVTALDHSTRPPGYIVRVARTGVLRYLAGELREPTEPPPGCAEGPPGGLPAPAGPRGRVEVQLRPVSSTAGRGRRVHGAPSPPAPAKAELSPPRGAAPRAGHGFTFGPAVALGLLPSHAAGAHQAPATPPQRPAAAALAPMPPAPSYSEVWAEVARAAPPSPVVAPIGAALAYQDLCLEQLGPEALAPSGPAAPEVPGYEQQGLEVERPAEARDYGRLLQVLRPEVDDAGLVPGSSRAQMSSVLAKNVELREAMQRDVARMRSAGQPVLGFEGTDHGFHMIDLEILVLKATALPPAPFPYTSDPYVRVSVVDGDPFGREAAAAGQAWYSEREQYHGETLVLRGTQDPEWRCRLRARVRPREGTSVHFRVFDRDELAFSDGAVGQCAVPLGEVQQDRWHAPRAVALRPMDPLDQQQTAALRPSRLFLAVQWHGVQSKVASRPAGFGGAPHA
ncbi:unnamed protein product, partial [Prorocentrum cordatum]